MKLTYHRLVQREVSEAVRWYEEAREGLGDDFFAKLTAILDAVADRPEIHGFWLGSGTIRRAKLKRFPYAVLYEIRPGKVRILCVRHDKRHPAYGMSRD
jgi:plasmid stabilization system protein ParE